MNDSTIEQEPVPRHGRPFGPVTTIVILGVLVALGWLAVSTVVTEMRLGRIEGGPSAGWTRDRVEALSSEVGRSGQPLLMPVSKPPPQVRPSTAGWFFPHDGPQSEDRGVHWRTEYDRSAFDDRSDSIVLQQPERLDAQSTCSENEEPSITRRVNESRLTICLGDSPTPQTRHYWASVEFTDDPGQVAWLPEG